MQKIRSSNPPVATGICDPNKSRARHYCNLRHTSQFLVDPIYSVFNASESASYLGPKIWEQIPFEIKNINSLVGFKKKLENGNLRIAPVEFAKCFRTKYRY